MDLELKTPVILAEMYLSCEGRRPEPLSRVQGGSPESRAYVRLKYIEFVGMANDSFSDKNSNVDL